MIKYTEEWEQYKRKDGKPGHWFRVQGLPYTPLVTCQQCGLTSTPKKVQYRSLAAHWPRFDRHDYLTPDKGTLCMSCWNKVRVVVKISQEVEETRTLINRLRRSISSDRKQADSTHEKKTIHT